MTLSLGETAGEKLNLPESRLLGDDASCMHIISITAGYGYMYRLGEMTSSWIAIVCDMPWQGAGLWLPTLPTCAFDRQTACCSPRWY